MREDRPLNVERRESQSDKEAKVRRFERAMEREPEAPERRPDTGRQKDTSTYFREEKRIDKPAEDERRPRLRELHQSAFARRESNWRPRGDKVWKREQIARDMYERASIAAERRADEKREAKIQGFKDIGNKILHDVKSGFKNVPGKGREAEGFNVGKVRRERLGRFRRVTGIGKPIRRTRYGKRGRPKKRRRVLGEHGSATEFFFGGL